MNADEHIARYGVTPLPMRNSKIHLRIDQRAFESLCLDAAAELRDTYVYSEQLPGLLHENSSTICREDISSFFIGVLFFLS